MASLEELNNLLTEATRLLDKAASQIRDLNLNKQTNIRKVGEALVLAFEIQRDIYERRPDLTPDFLKKK